jgi:hypothetical protein
MASPWSNCNGESGGSPFINQFVEIKNEKIKIKLNSTFSEASYEINYTINATKEGLKIPLLFLALEYKKDFQIWLDGKPVELKGFPYNYYSLSDNSKTKDFNYFLDENERVEVKLGENRGLSYKLNNLKYFEVDLSLGTHSVEIRYVAQPCEFSGTWIKEYYFRYSLYPAKYWKTFEKLEIELDATNVSQKVTTNLNSPKHDFENKIMTWKFDSIPTQTLDIKYIPEINSQAKFLISIGPYYLSLIVFWLLIIIHYFLARNYRQKSSAKYSWVAIIGSIINPFLMYLAYVYSIDYIDYLIGEHSSKNFANTSFYVILFYPINFIIYIVIAWQLDKYWKIKKQKTV